MFPTEWVPPCGSFCTKKFAALTQIPWRVFCKKGCGTDSETWEECLEECSEICYKDPVLKEHQWTAYIDRSPGDDNYSLDCFNACVAGCGFKFNIPSQKVEQAKPNRPPRPATKSKPASSPHVEHIVDADDLPCTSA